MGQWNTLHTFDEEIYKANTSVLLKNEEMLLPFYNYYVSHYALGKCELSLSSFIEYANIFSNHINELFKIGIPKVNENKLPLDENEEYHFIKFFTFLLFQTSAEYYPYFRLGYRAFAQAIKYVDQNAISVEILDEILNSYNVFNSDGAGIRKIILPEDLKLLSFDLDNIIPNTSDDINYLDEFKKYIQLLSEKGLGIVSGLDLYSRSLARSTPGQIFNPHILLENLIYE